VASKLSEKKTPVVWMRSCASWRFMHTTEGISAGAGGGGGGGAAVVVGATVVVGAAVVVVGVVVVVVVVSSAVVEVVLVSEMAATSSSSSGWSAVTAVKAKRPNRTVATAVALTLAAFGCGLIQRSTMPTGQQSNSNGASAHHEKYHRTGSTPDPRTGCCDGNAGGTGGMEAVGGSYGGGDG
jgi:hypothetical protein